MDSKNFGWRLRNSLESPETLHVERFDAVFDWSIFLEKDQRDKKETHTLQH
jgi:hypothetical protein